MNASQACDKKIPKSLYSMRNYKKIIADKFRRLAKIGLLKLMTDVRHQATDPTIETRAEPYAN